MSTILASALAGWLTYKNQQRKTAEDAEAKREEDRSKAEIAKGQQMNDAAKENNAHEVGLIAKVWERMAAIEARADEREEALRKESSECWERHNVLSEEVFKLRALAEKNERKASKQDTVIAEIKSAVAETKNGNGHGETK